MGFISNQIKAQIQSKPQGKEVFPGQETGRALWQEIFGATDKERGMKQPQGLPKPPGAGVNRSLSASSTNSFMRLLEAYRTKAPGGWSDDRWEQTRHFTGIQYVAIHRVCLQLSQAEFNVYHKDPNAPDGKREVKEMDPPEGGRLVRPYDLVTLLQTPNKQDSFGYMMYQWGQQLRLTGKSLTWMVPNELGTPMELYSIPTALAIPQPVINPDYPEGYYRIQPVYPYGPFSSYPSPTSAVGSAIPAQWMMEFKYPHPFLRYDGYSPASGLRMEMDLFESIERSRWYGMKRSIQPSAVINFDGAEESQSLPPEEIARIHAEWENEFQGPENTGKLIVGTPGGKIESWGSRAVDMDYQSGWNQMADFILGGGYGITPAAAGMQADSSYSTLFATLKQLNVLTLDPETNYIAGVLTRVLGPFFGDNLIVEIRCKRIDDHDMKFSKVQLLMQSKAITKNEVRKEMDMPVTMEPWGEDMAGENSLKQAGTQMAQIQMQQEQAIMQAEAMGEQLPPDGSEEGPDESGEDPNMEAGRPDPGTGAEGSLGPRKDLFAAFNKQLKERWKGHYNGTLNGNGKHHTNGRK